MAQRRIEYQGEYFDISYERRKPLVPLETDAPIILFLHGWGSNKDIMKIAFSPYFKEYEHIYMDMPGFGKSPNQKPLYTYDYAAIVQEFLSSIESLSPRLLIVGHSFGGKVALLCNPKEIILLSSAGIKLAKSLRVRCKIGLVKFMKKCGLSGFTKMFRSCDVRGMNDGMYQTFKRVVEEDFSSFFSQYKGAASIFWGKSDSATPLFCGQTIANLIPNNRFFVLEGDHYFFLKQGAEIERLYRSIK